MYRRKDRSSGYLFEELMPLGGRLAEDNRWRKIKELIPWVELEVEYGKYFSDRGRPALDGRLVIGLLLLKHMSGLGDGEVVLALQENVYWQAFCGMEQFDTGRKLHPTALTKLRHRLGPKFMKALEDKTYRVLIEKKIIRRKGVLVDATVMPEKIKYPNDVGLLNDEREWAVKWLKDITRETGEKVRTYRRTARRVFLNFAKKKQKTREMVERAKKQMLQFVRRDLEQLRERVGELDYFMQREVDLGLEIAAKIYEQQKRMYDEKVRRCEGWIVSWRRTYVRPIKRGKMGGKEVEFGPKIALIHVDGFTFLDEFSHDNCAEARVDIVRKQIENYQERFGCKPPSMTGDQLYGNRENRALLEKEEIRSVFKPLGRKGKESARQERFVRWKQRERNRIEGDIGNVKEHYGGDEIRYHYVEGSEMWVRLCLLAKNLKAALPRSSFRSL